MTIQKSSLIILIIALLSLLNASCGKSIDFGPNALNMNGGNGNGSGSGNGNSNSNSNSSGSLYGCAPTHVEQWAFVQSSGSCASALDILFVIDTSSGMKSKLSQVSAQIPLL